MSAVTPRSIADEAAAAVVAVAWAQWSALTGMAVSADGREARSIVDPEALVLASLAVWKRERRIVDVLAAWASEASALMSVQRLTSLGRRFSPAVRESIPQAALFAVTAGDHRWKRLAAGGHLGSVRDKRLGPLHLARRPALMLRLRAGFGVGAKADVLAMLLGLHGSAARVATIAAATAYSARTVRAAAEEMVVARLIHALPGTPAAYRADPAAWAPLLGPPGAGDAEPRLGTWRFWGIVLAFLTDAAAWGDSAESEGWTPYVAASRARDLVERHGPHLRHTGWPIPHDPDAHGEAYLDAFQRIVRFASERAVADLDG